MPLLYLRANAQANGKPLDSIPAKMSTSLGWIVFVNSSITSDKAAGSLKRGLMSLNKMPFFGKSGISAIFLLDS